MLAAPWGCYSTVSEGLVVMLVVMRQQKARLLGAALMHCPFVVRVVNACSSCPARGPPHRASCLCLWCFFPLAMFSHKSVVLFATPLTLNSSFSLWGAGHISQVKMLYSIDTRQEAMQCPQRALPRIA